MLRACQFWVALEIASTSLRSSDPLLACFVVLIDRPAVGLGNARPRFPAAADPDRQRHDLDALLGAGCAERARPSRVHLQVRSRPRGRSIGLSTLERQTAPDSKNTRRRGAGDQHYVGAWHRLLLAGSFVGLRSSNGIGGPDRCGTRFGKPAFCSCRVFAAARARSRGGGIGESFVPRGSWRLQSRPLKPRRS